ncbi:MAG: acyl-CoA dehydrogenase [Alphaproteobacteria bacterium]|nr:acyl-CoA dehydrogenase [Alphaproteobacteria bacterium]
MADRSFLSWPFFDDRHRRMAESFDVWAEKALPPLIDGDHAPGDDAALDRATRRLVGALGAGGWLAHCIPAEYSGAVPGRIDVRAVALLRESLARRSGLADFAFAMQGLGTGPITLFGTEAQKRAYLPAVARGEKVAAFAISEKDAGSDPAGMTMSAARSGDDYVLEGAKTWISNAGVADHYVVFARTGEAPGARGITAFVVDADTPGLSVTERIPVIAPHPLGTVTFRACRVPASARLGNPGEGFKIAMATLDIFRTTVGAAALGFSRRALDEALARTAERRIGGVALAEYQMTEDKIADMATAVDVAALLVYRAAWTKDTTGARITREAAMAKMYATEAAQQIIDKAVQLFGAMGVMSGGVVERLYRDIRPLRIYEGATEVQKLIIARQTRAEAKGQGE